MTNEFSKALNSHNPTALQRVLTNEGFSCTKAINSPSAYILEKKIIKHLKEKINKKDFSVRDNLIKFVRLEWFETRLNRISDTEKLEELYDTLMNEGLQQLIIKLKK